ncbi:unnamed protein product [Adineta steineri]|uniref:G-protein coupled receptors family 1 profile domain-containing protein n=1 Tax=Adineta steineri TaxID=433720 RepID=A0A814SV51_9BILA|nr:unnamed protein product [Adineta steineri]
MSISVSVLTLMAISIERYQAIVYPLKFTGTKQRARILIISIWILSILFVLPDAVMMTLSQQFGDRIPTIYLTYCQWNSHPLFDLLYQLHISLCLFIIPLCLMVYTYTGVARVLWGSLPSERVNHNDNFTRNSNVLTYSDDSHTSSAVSSTKSSNLIVQENRQKAAKMLISVVIIFAICFIPVHVFNLFRYIYVYLEYVKHPTTTNDSLNENFGCFEPTTVHLVRTDTIKIITISALISHFLPYFNSSINPIIYNIMSDKFRLKFRELFSSCCWCCTCCCCCSSKTVARMKSTSSTMIQYRTSGTIHHSSNSIINRSSMKNKHIKDSTSILNHFGGHDKITTNNNNIHCRSVSSDFDGSKEAGYHPFPEMSRFLNSNSRVHRPSSRPTYSFLGYLCSIADDEEQLGQFLVTFGKQYGRLIKKIIKTDCPDYNEKHKRTMLKIRPKNFSRMVLRNIIDPYFDF